MTAHEWLDAYLLGMPGATTDYKVEWEWQRYQVGGKMFAATMQPGPQYHEYAGRRLVSLKCDPAWAEQLRAEFPDRRLEVIDSLCSSSGYGLLVDGAADLRDAGKSMDETIEWVMAWRKRVHHQFYSTDLKFFRRSGRVSGPAATVGAILGICPIMRLDDRGRIIAYDKVRGKKAAVRTTVEAMAAHAVGGEDYSGKCWICHSNCLEQAEITRDAVRARFPHIAGEIRICDIGTIIASHAGPGTVAVFFFGDERAPE